MDPKMQKQNLDSSILFMQQEHARTLGGLHDEIEKLQKRCSDLTFQIAMDNTSVSQEAKLLEQCDQLGKECKEEKKKAVELENALEKKDKKIAMLEQQLKAQERKYVDELNSKKQTISAMSKELDSKAGTVARLMTELHTTKVKLKACKHVDAKPQVSAEVTTRSIAGSAGSRSARSSGSGSSRSEDSREFEAVHQPLPPKDAPPKSRRRHVGRVAHSQQIPSVVNRAPSSRILSASSDNSDLVPDPTPFLLVNREDSSTLLSTPAFRKSGKAPLPPIAVKTGTKHHDNSTLLPQSTDSYKFVHHSTGNANRERGSPSSPEVEVETLAVDQVTKRTHSLRRAHEYRSSDY